MPDQTQIELQAIEQKLNELKQQRDQLEALREARISLIKQRLGLFTAQLQNIGPQFAANHPILAGAAEATGETAKGLGKEIFGGLKKAGQYLAENKARVDSNRAFSKGLREGQSAFNVATGQYVTRTAEDEYTATKRQLVNV